MSLEHLSGGALLLTGCGLCAFSGPRAIRSVVLVGALLGASGASPRDLSFEDRVEAQRAIERVYYSHQNGAKRSFEEAVPREVLERKVSTYLKQSAALAAYWNNPITGEALRREMERMGRGTRFPDRLEEVYGALGNDAFLIQETLARGALANRLARNFFSADERIHAETREETEGWRARVASGRGGGLAGGRRAIVEYSSERETDEAGFLARRVGRDDAEVIRIDVSHQELDRLRGRWPDGPGAIGPIEESVEGFSFRILREDEPGRVEFLVHTIPKITWDTWWEAASERFDETRVPSVADGDAALPEARAHARSDTAALSCAPNDFWENGSLDDPGPSPRMEHVAVWTGTEMIVWGGWQGFFADALVTGERYDPLTDTWSPLSASMAPASCCRAAAVWTGTRMLVWGGVDSNFAASNTGGRYDPVSDTWEPISLSGAPSPRQSHTAVWTGNEMVVWGGSPQNTGGRYDPAGDTWAPTSTTGAPTPRGGHSAVWTGSEMIVWGGSGQNTGGRYNPMSDTWIPTATLNAPSPRGGHSAVWTGDEMVVWGGPALSTGGRYNPVTDTWSATSEVDAPEGREHHTTVWTGDRMVVWGGEGNISQGLLTGGRYDPVTDVWTPTSWLNVPVPRSHHTAVWTGDRMLIWGGADILITSVFDSGARYDPVTNTWTPTVAPVARYDHSAVWTGNLMVICGGTDGSSLPLSSGARYDPVTDTLSPTSMVNSGSPRSRHSALWTGDEMIVWGGGGGRTGRRYDPIADSWLSTTTTNAPSFRVGHRAVWTGSEMIVWGGSNGGGPGTRVGFNTGGRYDPSTDTWLATSTVGAPSPRENHSAVWTGSGMIVWGGTSGDFTFTSLDTGGRYDPTSDSWIPLTTAGAPSARAFHTAFWSGSDMIVGAGCDGRRYRPAEDQWHGMNPVGAVCANTAVWTGSEIIVWTGGDTQGSGGRYHAQTDTWLPMSMSGAPESRSGSAAVWTGTQMIAWGGVQPGLVPVNTGGVYHPGTDVSPDSDGDGVTLCLADCDDADPWVYPTAPQLCDGRNNDCRHPAWPSIAETNEADDDGDSFSECQGDCDDGDAEAWAAPGAIGGLTFTEDSTLIWAPPAQPGGMTISYDTIRAIDPSGFATSMTCVESDASDTVSIDMMAPALGGIAYYLARAQNACGLGSLGTASNGTSRLAGDCHSPPTLEGARLDR